MPRIEPRIFQASARSQHRLRSTRLNYSDVMLQTPPFQDTAQTGVPAANAPRGVPFPRQLAADERAVTSTPAVRAELANH